MGYYAAAEAPDTHLQAFFRGYLFARRLKTLKGLTPHEFGCAEWHKNATFHRAPTQLSLGLYQWPVPRAGRRLAVGKAGKKKNVMLSEAAA